MRDGRTDLAGHAGLLRSECSHLLHHLDLLDAIANDRVQLPEGAHLEIMDISARYAQTAKDHLEYAVDALLQWLDQAENVIKEHKLDSSFDRLPSLYYQ